MEKHIHRSRNVPRYLKFNSAQIPAVFDNALTFYETVCALSLFVQNDVVDVINNNADATAEAIDYMQNKIVETTTDVVNDAIASGSINASFIYNEIDESLTLKIAGRV